MKAIKSLFTKKHHTLYACVLVKIHCEQADLGFCQNTDYNPSRRSSNDIAKPPRVCSILLVVCSSCLWFLLRYRDCGILEWNPVPFPIPSRTRIPSRYRFLRDTG